MIKLEELEKIENYNLDKYISFRERVKEKPRMVRRFYKRRS